MADFKQQTPAARCDWRWRGIFFHTGLVETDFNARNSSGDTPLRFALDLNMHGVLTCMLANPADADFERVNFSGQTFSHAIARTADIQTVKILREARPITLKADVESRDASGKTSLD